MSQLFEKSMLTLELPRVLELLKECAMTEEGRERSLTLRPMTDMDDVLRAQQETTAAVDMLLNGSEFVVLYDQDEFFGSFEDDEFCVTLGRCDEKFLFVEHYVVEIVSKREGFYLFLDGRLATVPAEYNDVFRNIVADFYENEVAPYISEY